MEVSGVAVPSAPANTTVAIEVQKKAQDVQAQVAETLIKSVPDPASSKGQNIDVKAWRQNKRNGVQRLLALDPAIFLHLFIFTLIFFF